MKHKLDFSSHDSNKKEEVFIISYKNSAERTRKVSLTGSVKSSADFEKAIKETGYGKFNYLLLLLAFPASCSSTYDTTSLSYVLPTATCDLKLDDYDRGYLTGTIYAGMILSAFPWGYISDKYGRQRVLVYGYLGDVIFGVAASLSHSFWPLLIFKLLSGVMICGPFSVFMSYLSELFHAKHRDRVVMVVGLFQSIGGIIQPLLAWLIIPQDLRWTVAGLSINSWRLFLLICSVPALIAGIGTLFCHESPKFLISKGRRDEALGVFRSIYSFNTGKPKSSYSVKKLRGEPETSETTEKLSFWQEITALFRPPHLYKAFLAFSIQFGGLMTLNPIRLWLPQFFFYVEQSHGAESLTTCEILGDRNTTSVRPVNCDNFKVDTSVYTNMLYVNILTTVSFSLSILIVKRIGKKTLLVSLFLMQSVVICGLGWVKPPLITAMAALFVALSNTTGIGLLGFVVQIFPTAFRTMAVSLTMMFGRTGVVIGSAVLPFFLSLSCPGTFVGISIITLFCALVLLVLAATAARKPPDESTQT